MKKSVLAIMLGSVSITSFSAGWYARPVYDNKELINSVKINRQQPLYFSYISQKRKLEEGLTLFSEDPQGDLSRILRSDMINPRGDDGHRYKVHINLNENKVDIKPDK